MIVVVRSAVVVVVEIVVIVAEGGGRRIGVVASVRLRRISRGTGIGGITTATMTRMLSLRG